MILLGLLLVQLAPPRVTRVTYQDLPTDVVSAEAYSWSDVKAPVRLSATAVQSTATFRLDGVPGTRVVVLFTRRNGGYVIDGPFVWPDHAAERRQDGIWRRSISDAGPPRARAGSTLEWLSAHGDAEWPRCRWSTGSRWECWGVPAADSGVVLQSDGATVSWRVVQPSGMSVWRQSAWARLLVMRDPDGNVPEQLRVRPERAIPPPAYRFKDVRLETGPEPSVTIVPLSAGSMWLAGSAVPAENSWIAISARDAAPMFVPLTDLATGTTALVQRIQLDPIRRLQGTVVAGDQRGRRATVTLFRLIDPRPRPGDRLKPRRVFAAETTADEDGAFGFDVLGNADYEVLAWHPQLGHASVFLQPGQSVVIVRLEGSGIARGRVVMAGKPVAGVDVFSVPDATAVSTADDPVNLKGGDTRTDGDGRFAVALAPSGGGELRIGGGSYSTRRVPLPASPLPLVDLGDIELSAPMIVHIVLDRDPGCGLMATGPVGRLGLQIVTGERTGPGLFDVSIAEEGEWQFGLDCGGTIRPLLPTVVSIGPALNGKEVRLSVAR